MNKQHYIKHCVLKVIEKYKFIFIQVGIDKRQCQLDLHILILITIIRTFLLHAKFSTHIKQVFICVTTTRAKNNFFFIKSSFRFFGYLEVQTVEIHSNTIQNSSMYQL